MEAQKQRPRLPDATGRSVFPFSSFLSLIVGANDEAKWLVSIVEVLSTWALN